MAETRVGASCAVHPERSAPVTCSRCGAFACAECLVIANGDEYCAACGARAGEFAPPAERSARFLATFADSFVLMAMVVVPPAVVAFFLGTRQLGVGVEAAILVGMMGAVSLQLRSQLVYGQSVGKRWQGIKVVRRDGSNVSLARLIFLRNAVLMVGAQLGGGLPALVDTVMIFGAEQRCLHDYIADTKVIRVSAS